MDLDKERDTLPLIGHRVLDTRDLDEARTEVARRLAPHRLIPLAQDGQVHVVQHYAAMGAIGVGALSYGGSVEIQADAPEEFYLVGIPLRGRLRVRCGPQEMIVTPGRGAIINPTDPVWTRWHPDTAVLTVRLDRAALLARAEEWAGRQLRGTLRFDPALDPATGLDRSWCDQVWALVRDLEAGDGWAADTLLAGRWADLLLDGMLLGHPSTHQPVLLRGDEPSAPPRALRQLLEQIQEHPERPWTTPAMARAAGVGVRAIQKAFARHLDIAPQAYLRQIRLARVRADLLAADPTTTTVRQIATRWGFTELGRLASTYRARYGEPPSDTLHGH